MAHKADFTHTGGGTAGPSLGHLVLDHLEDLEIAGRASITAKRYGAYLDTFLEWLAFQTHKDPAELHADDVTDERLRMYRLFLSRRRDPQTGRPIVASTRNLYQIALRGFLTYVARRRKIAIPDPEDTLELAKERDIEIRYLDRAEVDRIREAIDLSKPNGVRDRAVLEMLFGTGVRVSELAALTIRQVDLARREAEVIGKGGRSRLVLLTEEAAGWVDRYIATRTDDHPAMFVRSHRKDVQALSVRRIQKILDDAAKRAGLPFRVSPHMLRHSRLTILARHAGVQAAQRIAGHSSLATTSRYLHLSDPHLRAAYDKAEKADQSG
ncbi:MAG: tyrosine-type recombinase/integrase [Candidatus Limnocylindria bacterium]